jgi:drug/metabolite transporter (DMT)-like permease
VSNRGIGRGRLFMGNLLLAAAVITWGTSFMMSPHGQPVTPGTEHVRSTVVVFVRNSAIGTLVLSALSGWLLFPERRPHKPLRDRLTGAVLLILVVSSLYQLIWLRHSL